MEAVQSFRRFSHGVMVNIGNVCDVANHLSGVRCQDDHQRDKRQLGGSCFRGARVVIETVSFETLLAEIKSDSSAYIATVSPEPPKARNGRLRRRDGNIHSATLLCSFIRLTKSSDLGEMMISILHSYFGFHKGYRKYHGFHVR